MSSNSSRIYTVAGMPRFVGDKKDLGLEMVANKREGFELANTISLHPNRFSISLWIKNAKNSQPYGVVISHSNRNGTAGWSVDSQALSQQSISFSIFNNRGQQFTSPPAPISNDTFTHIVGTFNGSSIKIYKNGILLGNTEFKGQYVTNPDVPLRIGSSAFCLTCNWWSGIIKDLRFYNKVINENEVREIFSNDLPSIVSDGLVGYWAFNGNLNDSSGNNNHGILNSLIANITFAPDGRLFFDEINTGQIKIMKDNKVLPTSFATISDYYVNWEQGLLGLTIDPKFAQNHFVYLYDASIDITEQDRFLTKLLDSLTIIIKVQHGRTYR